MKKAFILHNMYLQLLFLIFLLSMQQFYINPINQTLYIVFFRPNFSK